MSFPACGASAVEYVILVAALGLVLWAVVPERTKAPPPPSGSGGVSVAG